jgi:hypothetical protein
MKYDENVIGRLQNQEPLHVISEAALRALIPQRNRKRCVVSEIAIGLIFAALMLIWANESGFNSRSRTRTESVSDQQVPSRSETTKTPGFLRALSE